MPNWLSWLIAFARGILGIKEDAAVTNAKEAGADEQAMKDQGAGYAQVQGDAAAASAVDQRIVLDDASSDRVVPAANLTNDPDLPQR